MTDSLRARRHGRGMGLAGRVTGVVLDSGERVGAGVAAGLGRVVASCDRSQIHKHIRCLYLGL
jgi:hypothetical protein